SARASLAKRGIAVLLKAVRQFPAIYPEPGWGAGAARSPLTAYRSPLPSPGLRLERVLQVRVLPPDDEPPGDQQVGRDEERPPPLRLPHVHPFVGPGARERRLVPPDHH